MKITELENVESTKVFDKMSDSIELIDMEYNFTRTRKADSSTITDSIILTMGVEHPLEDYFSIKCKANGNSTKENNVEESELIFTVIIKPEQSLSDLYSQVEESHYTNAFYTLDVDDNLLVPEDKKQSFKRWIALSIAEFFSSNGISRI